MNKSSQYTLPLIIAAVSAFSMLIGMRLQESLVYDGYLIEDEKDEYLAIYETLEHVKEKYYGQIDDSAYVAEVLDEMMAGLDPYSQYFGPIEDDRYNRFISGDYAGIGLDFASDGSAVYVYVVIPGSPADDQEIAIGAQLLTYEGVQIDSKATYDSIANNLTNEIGDTVHMTLLSSLDNQELEYTFVKRQIHIPLIHDYLMPLDGQDGYVAIIEIRRFYKNVYRDLMTVLENYQDKDIKGLVIDLRNNPGGVVEETIKLLNQFIKDKDQLLLSTTSKNEITKAYKSNGRTFFDIEKMVIVINENSASASEILAGVLQDHDRAVVIGSTSFGKGLIQQNFDLSNEGSINLSIGEYLLPSGRSIYDVQSDTSFYTLHSKREIKGSSGVSPDILLDDCESSYLKSKSKHLFAEHQLWKLENPDKIHELVTSVTSPDDDQCAAYLTAAMTWGLSKHLFSKKDVSLEVLDLHLREAVDVLTSERYDNILRGSNTNLDH